MSTIRIDLLVRYETGDGKDITPEDLDSLQSGVMRGLERCIDDGLLTGGDVEAVVAEYHLVEAE